MDSASLARDENQGVGSEQPPQVRGSLGGTEENNEQLQLMNQTKTNLHATRVTSNLPNFDSTMQGQVHQNMQGFGDVDVQQPIQQAQDNQDEAMPAQSTIN